MAHKRERKSAHGFHSIVAVPKRRKIENMMIPDDVLHNILCRLSAKPLMRFRCASKHLNSLITDPYFINSRSRRMILVSSTSSHLNYALDEKHPNIIGRHTYPFEGEIQRSSIVGTFNGIVILVLQTPLFVCPRIFILYNPLTRAVKKLPDPPFDLCCTYSGIQFTYGFGHGNIIFAEYMCHCPYRKLPYCHVFSLKKGSWTHPETLFSSRGALDEVGVYVNGILYWIYLFSLQYELYLTAFDIKEMRSSNPPGPRPLSRHYYQLSSSVLGTCNGCLCLIARWHNGFDVWLKTNNEKRVEWLKQYSLALPFYPDGYANFLDFCILEDGRIVTRDDYFKQIVVFHQSGRCYDIFGSTARVGRFKKGIEYVESLASPSDYMSLSYA